MPVWVKFRYILTYRNRGVKVRRILGCSRSKMLSTYKLLFLPREGLILLCFHNQHMETNGIVRRIKGTPYHIHAREVRRTVVRKWSILLVLCRRGFRRYASILCLFHRKYIHTNEKFHCI